MTGPFCHSHEMFAHAGLSYLWRVVLDGPPGVISDRARTVLVNLHVNLADNLVPKKAEVRSALLTCALLASFPCPFGASVTLGIFLSHMHVLPQNCGSKTGIVSMVYLR